MVQKIKVLLFEKSYLIRQGLISVLGQFEQCDVLSEFQDLDQFHSAIKKDKPHIVFIGMDLISIMSEKMVFNLKNEYKCQLIGICKSDDSSICDLLDSTVRLNGEKDSVLNHIAGIVDSIRNISGLKRQDNQLSDREKNIVGLVAKGLTNKEIASELFLSVHTVITHRKNIGKKLGIKSVSGITVYAILNKIIDMNDLH